MNLNKVLLAGRLTFDPELKTLPSGMQVCTIRVATNRFWNDSVTNERREEVCFIDIDVYGKRAPIVNQHFRKGSNIFVDGHLQYQTWEKEGTKRSKHVVVLDNFEFVDPAPGNRSTSGPAEEPSDSREPEGAEAASNAVRAGSSVARRRREKALAAAGAGVDPAQLPF